MRESDELFKYPPGKHTVRFCDVKNAQCVISYADRKHLLGFFSCDPICFGIAWMVRRKMCVKPMEENEDDKVVSMIINYFNARVNIAKDYRENLIETFTRQKSV